MVIFVIKNPFPGITVPKAKERIFVKKRRELDKGPERRQGTRMLTCRIITGITVPILQKRKLADLPNTFFPASNRAVELCMLREPLPLCW